MLSKTEAASDNNNTFCNNARRVLYDLQLCAVSTRVFTTRKFAALTTYTVYGLLKIGRYTVKASIHYQTVSAKALCVHRA